MISKEKFNFIKNEYGHWGSWAVWAEEGERPKSNVGDLTIFENDEILNVLNPQVILVGLNISRNDIEQPFANFHSKKSKAQEYKLRYALKGTPLWGAYMTDIIKDYDELDSRNVIEHLRKNTSLEEDNVKIFQQELVDLGSKDQIIIALGNVTHEIMLRNFSHLTVVKIKHFSYRMSKEKYREEVKNSCSAMKYYVK